MMSSGRRKRTENTEAVHPRRRAKIAEDPQVSEVAESNHHQKRRSKSADTKAENEEAEEDTEEKKGFFDKFKF